MVHWIEITIDPSDPIAGRRRERSELEIAGYAVDYFAALVARGGYWSDGLLGSAATVEANRPADGVLIAAWRLSDAPADTTPLAVSLYLAGDEPRAVEAFQAGFIEPLAAASRSGPIVALLEETARPLLFTILVPRQAVPSRAEAEARKIIGDAESCLAAAFFRAAAREGRSR